VTPTRAGIVTNCTSGTARLASVPASPPTLMLATDTVSKYCLRSTINAPGPADRLSDLAVPAPVQREQRRQYPYSNSVASAEAAAAAGHPFQLQGYESAEHYFSGSLREQAADRTQISSEAR